ncbi:hypothetical protein F53441_12547 [Fusarium austroafricanum]|uniref:Uncharacterized protein n=1 Tax=Fusarium austroafricanum TaxID=2364996 RepID=A0A8H4NPL0_9HYPO|nr:hypothetical protein F53441_12547 [Fusarium austroafricanum]
MRASSALFSGHIVVAPSGMKWELGHGVRSNPPYARPLLERRVVTVSEAQSVPNRMGNRVPKPFQGFGFAKVTIPRSFLHILGQLHGTYLVLLHEYGIAAALTGIYDDDGTAHRSSPQFCFARSSQEVLEPGVSLNPSNQLIEFVAC